MRNKTEKSCVIDFNKKLIINNNVNSKINNFFGFY